MIIIMIIVITLITCVCITIVIDISKLCIKWHNKYECYNTSK